MRVNGQVISAAKQVVPILRESGNLFFQVKVVPSMAPFLALCPYPTAPTLTLPGGVKKQNTEDKGYKEQENQWWTKRQTWMFLQSITILDADGKLQDIEWEKVKVDDPETYSNFIPELTESGLADAELNKILNAVYSVNGLNETQIDEARRSFLAMPEGAQNGSISQKVAAPTT